MFSFLKQRKSEYLTFNLIAVELALIVIAITDTYNHTIDILASLPRYERAIICLCAN